MRDTQFVRSVGEVVVVREWKMETDKVGQVGDMRDRSVAAFAFASQAALDSLQLRTDLPYSLTVK